MFNLGTVVKFEILKQIRKPLFWLAVFATPALIILFGGVSYLGAKLSHEQTDKNKQQVAETSQKIIVVDHSKLIKTNAFGIINDCAQRDGFRSHIKEDGDAAQHKVRELKDGGFAGGIARGCIGFGRIFVVFARGFYLGQRCE